MLFLFALHVYIFLIVQVRKYGRVEMIEDLIDQDLITTEDLIDKYNIEEN